MIRRELVEKEFEKAHKGRGFGGVEQLQLMLSIALQVQLDIRDLLIEIRDRGKEVVVDFVPPDYGKED